MGILNPSGASLTSTILKPSVMRYIMLMQKKDAAVSNFRPFRLAAILSSSQKWPRLFKLTATKALAALKVLLCIIHEPSAGAIRRSHRLGSHARALARPLCVASSDLMAYHFEMRGSVGIDAGLLRSGPRCDGRRLEGGDGAHSWLREAGRSLPYPSASAALGAIIGPPASASP